MDLELLLPQMFLAEDLGGQETWSCSWLLLLVEASGAEKLLELLLGRADRGDLLDQEVRPGRVPAAEAVVVSIFSSLHTSQQLVLAVAPGQTQSLRSYLGNNPVNSSVGADS